MTSNLRRFIRKLHLTFDGVVGSIFSQQGTLDKLATRPHSPIKASDISNFNYSKITHFKQFRTLPIHKKQSPATCDLKIYQDALVYTYILDNFQPGARLLEIGGGESRIIAELKGRYEIWNLDKLEGSGFGPTDLIKTDGFQLVRDYIGTFSSELPSEYFDLVFSISTIEHLPKSPQDVDSVIKDNQRLLKPGGFSLHCVDALLYQDEYYIHPFVPRVYELGFISGNLPTFNEIVNDDRLWCLPAYAFYTRWFHLVKKSMARFGYPFSINLLWQK
jgi:SAM-dependent methyltransferase